MPCSLFQRREEKHKNTLFPSMRTLNLFVIYEFVLKLSNNCLDKHQKMTKKRKIWHKKIHCYAEISLLRISIIFLSNLALEKKVWQPQAIVGRLIILSICGIFETTVYSLFWLVTISYRAAVWPYLFNCNQILLVPPIQCTSMF